MVFSALSIGYLAAKRLSDQDRLLVHSCFQRALNLRHPDGYLLPLLNSEFQDLPDAIRIVVSTPWDWRDHTQVGETVIFHHGILQGTSWSIALGQAPCWQPEKIDTPSLPNALHHYATLAWQLGQYCQLHHCESDLQLLPGREQRQALYRPAPRRVELELSDTPEKLRAEVTAVIGYGQGLTPDGDDYLLGYMAALWPWRQLPAITTHDCTLRSLIASQLSRTNDISRHYLARALEGHFSAPICQLMSALNATTSSERLESAAREVMQFGASSGVDCLAGILHGLRTLQSSL